MWCCHRFILKYLHLPYYFILSPVKIYLVWVLTGNKQINLITHPIFLKIKSFSLYRKQLLVVFQKWLNNQSLDLEHQNADFQNLYYGCAHDAFLLSKLMFNQTCLTQWLFKIKTANKFEIKCRKLYGKKYPTTYIKILHFFQILAHFK